mmetsp:Transcript_50552/g.109620  ORF Transcript_50552/g.109620 Transcript_50552/m.109620 type:complete len:168 (-) Transcript_50552:180-683(-)
MPLPTGAELANAGAESPVLGGDDPYSASPTGSPGVPSSLATINRVRGIRSRNGSNINLFEGSGAAFNEEIRITPPYVDHRQRQDNMLPPQPLSDIESDVTTRVSEEPSNLENATPAMVEAAANAAANAPRTIAEEGEPARPPHPPRGNSERVVRTPRGAIMSDLFRI